MKSLPILTFAAFSCLLAGCVFSGSRNGEPAASASPSASAADPAKSEGGGAAFKPGEIKKTDFKNYTYETNCAGEKAEKLTVKNGEYSREKGDDRVFFNVYAVTYGDVNGDADDDAIVLTNCNTGGTGQFSEGWVFAMKDGKPSLIANIEGGDRAYGGIRSAKAEGGVILVDQNDAGDEGGACCPEFAIVTKYKFDGKGLKKIGADPRRELYPAQRVKFSRGETSTTISLKLSADDDIKRYVVGASAGQTLFVTTSSKDLTLSLIDGEGETLQDGESLEVNLNENGDFKFQLQKTSEKSVNATLTIEIR